MLYPFEPFPELSTKNLTLSALKDTDTSGLFRLRSDSVTAEILCRMPHHSEKETAAHIDFLRQDMNNHQSITWVLSEKRSPDFLGSICLWNFSEKLNKAEIGYELLPEFRGHGYMREAASAVIDYGFKKMKLSYIEATPPKANPRSVHLLEKSGFIRDGERTVKGGNGNPLIMWYYRLHSK